MRQVVAASLAGAVVLLVGCGPRPAATGGGSSAVGTPAAPTTRAVAPTPVPSDPLGPYDPARFAGPVRAYAARAGIHPQLLMAILYNESYKPHDPAAERAWQRIKPDAAFGIANMHRAAFEDTRRGRPFAGREWTELPDDPRLAIEAAAWYLHDLSRELPSSWPGSYTRDELLALGYNAGPGNMRLFARGVAPGPTAGAYLRTLRDNWDRAGAALRTGN
jgi:soluble lytic murein transglycosylase-like protein